MIKLIIPAAVRKGYKRSATSYWRSSMLEFPAKNLPVSLKLENIIISLT